MKYQWISQRYRIIFLLLFLLLLPSLCHCRWLYSTASNNEGFPISMSNVNKNGMNTMSYDNMINMHVNKHFVPRCYASIKIKGIHEIKERMKWHRKCSQLHSVIGKYAKLKWTSMNFRLNRAEEFLFYQIFQGQKRNVVEFSSWSGKIQIFVGEFKERHNLSPCYLRWRNLKKLKSFPPKDSSKYPSRFTLMQMDLHIFWYFSHPLFFFFFLSSFYFSLSFALCQQCLAFENVCI